MVTMDGTFVVANSLLLGLIILAVIYYFTLGNFDFLFPFRARETEKEEAASAAEGAARELKNINAINDAFEKLQKQSADRRADGQAGGGTAPVQTSEPDPEPVEPEPVEPEPEPTPEPEPEPESEPEPEPEPELPAVPKESVPPGVPREEQEKARKACNAIQFLAAAGARPGGITAALAPMSEAQRWDLREALGGQTQDERDRYRDHLRATFVTPYLGPNGEFDAQHVTDLVNGAPAGAPAPAPVPAPAPAPVAGDVAADVLAATASPSPPVEMWSMWSLPGDSHSHNACQHMHPETGRQCRYLKTLGDWCDTHDPASASKNARRSALPLN